MNKICHKYIMNIKALFPYIGKYERNYLKKLELNVLDYYEESGITSIEELYNNFGTPADIVHEYYTSIDTPVLLRQIKRSRLIKAGLVFLLLLGFIITSAYCLSLYTEYQTFAKDAIYTEETNIH